MLGQLTSGEIERVIQVLMANHLVVFCASAATRLGIEVFDTGISFVQRPSTEKTVVSLKVEHLLSLVRAFVVLGSGTIGDAATDGVRGEATAGLALFSDTRFSARAFLIFSR